MREEQDPRDPWRERLSAYLDGELDPEEERALAEHLPGCVECSGALEELRELIAAAGELPPREPERDLWPAIAEVIAERDRVPRRSGVAPWLLGMAAGVALTLSVLWTFAENGEGAREIVARGERFLLILHEPAGEPQELAPAEIEAVVDEYRRWAIGLASEGRLEAAEKLHDGEGFVLRPGAGGQVAVEPRTEWGGIGGVFLLHAQGYDEAVEITRGSPHLAYGGWVELRRVEDT